MRPLILLSFLLGCSDYAIVAKTLPSPDMQTPYSQSEFGESDLGEMCEPPNLAPVETAIDDTCGEVRPLEAVLEWSDPNVGSTLVSPVIGSLTDDDGDGVIGPLDMPDIVLQNWDHELVVFSGDGTGEHWRVSLDGWGSTVPALGDIDGDGTPDIVTANRIDGLTVVQAWDGPTGAFKWGRKIPDLGCLHSTLGIYDLDGDGAVEVVFGKYILHGDNGRIRGVGGFGVGSSSTFNVSSVAADIDRDGDLEVVVGNAVYDADGNALWTNDEADGWVAVANFDLDDNGEIVVVDHVQGGQVRMLDEDGTVVWRLDLEASELGRPTVADYDGDGEAEIAIASKTYLFMLDRYGSELWRTPIDDTSSGFTGSSAFDFNGDGAAEVVYADQGRLWVFDGPTGTALLELGPHSSSTAAEFPVVADVDLDGHAEIILFSNDHPTYGTETGVKVFGSKWDDWPNTRPVWNQADYWVSNVEDGLYIPTTPEANWDSWNTFRSNPSDPYPVPFLETLALPLDVCEVECDLGRVRLVVRVGNGGPEPLPAGIPISVEALDDGEWSEVATLETSETVASGQSSEGLVLRLERTLIPEGTLRVVLDGAEGAELDECEPDNNVVEVSGLCEE